MRSALLTVMALVFSTMPGHANLSSSVRAAAPAALIRAAARDVVQNPGFTASGSGQGLFAPWWLELKGGTAATLQTDGSAPIAGTNAARVTITHSNGAAWGVQLEQHLALAANTSYLLTFWAKASSIQSLALALQQASAPYTPYYQSSVNVGPAWQSYSLSFSAKTADPDTFFAFNLGAATGSVSLDSVSLVANGSVNTATETATATQTATATPTNTATQTAAPGGGPSSAWPFHGLNLDGGEQGLCCGPDAFAPPATLDWAGSKGFNVFRAPIAWAHLQPTPSGAFDPTYLGMMDTLVSAARARGQQVAFVPMDRRGSPVADFVDLWTKLAQHYRNEPTVWGYDLMNEPDSAAWNTTYLPQIIAAIRQVDTVHTIIVETSTGGWGQNWNAHTAGLPVQDPANNVIYEAHFYFDTPANGQYPNGTAFDVPNNDVNIGVERATDFVTWCTASHARCYVGEVGIPGGWSSGDQFCTNGAATTDPRWLTTLDRFLTYLDQNAISWTYWEAGPFGDVNDLGPTCSGQDRPQMAILRKHLSHDS